MNLDTLFDGREPVVRAIYDRLADEIGRIGPFEAEPKKTSIHLVAESGFAGVHPRKTNVLLNIRTAEAIDSPRMRKIERVSANRFHNEMLLASPDEIDAEVVGWLRSAWALGAPKT